MSEEDLPSIVEYSVDLNDQNAPEPLPTGEYVASIRATKKRMSARETSYAEVLFHIPSDQYPADYTEGNPDGTAIAYRRVSLEDTPQGRYGTRRFIEAIGAPLGKRVNLEDWLGMEAAVEVAHEEYEGVNRAVIARVRAV